MKGRVDKSMGIVTHIAEDLVRIKPTEPVRLAKREGSQVYLQQNKKKAEAKGKNCHAKTMWSLEKPI
jgi:hypothetical protein